MAAPTAERATATRSTPALDPATPAVDRRLDRWLTPTWLETGSGLPPGVEPGIEPGTEDGEPGGARVLAATPVGLVTERTVAVLARFVGFLAGRALVPTEWELVRSLVVERAVLAPEPTAAVLDTVARALHSIPGRHPVGRAALRYRILTGHPFAGSALESPDLTACLRRRDPVVGETGDGRVVPTSSVRAWETRRLLVADVAGLDLRWGDDELRDHLAGLGSLPLGRQRELAFSPVSLVTTTTWLRSLNPADRSAVARTLAETVTGPESLEVLVAALAAGPRRADPARTLRNAVAAYRAAAGANPTTHT